MDVREDIVYDASPDAVFEMLCDKSFREEVCRAIHSVRYDVSISRDGDTATVRNHRVMEADMPDVAKRFVGDTVELVQTEEWGGRETDGARTADFHVQIPGKPGSVSGTISLSPTRTGTRESIAGTIKVSVPIVGKRLEAEVAKGLKAALEVEGRVGAKWLAERGARG